MDFKFNINHQVKVKLTRHGRSIIKQRYDHLNEMVARRTGGKGDKFTPTYEGEDGYYTDQLWSIMDTFGEYCGLGKEPPFDTEIIVTKGEPIEPERPLFGLAEITVTSLDGTEIKFEGEVQLGTLSEEQLAEECIKEIEATVDKYGFRLGWDKYGEKIELDSRESGKSYPLEWRE